MRIAQLDGQHGALKWIQRVSSRHSQQLETALQGTGMLPPGGKLTWLSPRRDDQWAEYRDEAFLSHIGRMDLADRLAAFWPKRGPQWSGLATDGRRRLFLLDAKAQLGELPSNCTVGPPARDQIVSSLEVAKRAYGADPAADWLNGYYKYASRLAHLHFLRSHQIDAVMAFIYFTHDPEAEAPVAMDDWKKETRAVAAHLGLKGRPVQGIVNLFLDTRALD